MKTLFFVAAFLALALGAPQEEAQSGPNPEAEADPRQTSRQEDHEDSLLCCSLPGAGTWCTSGRGPLDPTQRLRLIPGMATTDTATDHTDMATTATDLTDMATITERGLLMPSQLLKLLP